MPTIDDFVRPKEWVSDFVSDLGKVIRKWGEERYVPLRQQVDEDWVGGEELNGLGWILKQVMDETIQDPETWKAIKKLKGTLLVRETDSHVAVSIFFYNGELKILNGAIDKPTAYVEGGFEELSEISSGQVGPVRAL